MTTTAARTPGVYLSRCIISATAATVLVTLEVHIHEQVHAGLLFVKSLYERNHHTGEYVHIGWLFSRKKDFSSVEYRGVQ